MLWREIPETVQTVAGELLFFDYNSDSLCPHTILIFLKKPSNFHFPPTKIPCKRMIRVTTSVGAKRYSLLKPFPPLPHLCISGPFQCIFRRDRKTNKQTYMGVLLCVFDLAINDPTIAYGNLKPHIVRHTKVQKFTCKGEQMGHRSHE